MDRLFLDANVFFSAAYRADTGLLHLWKLKHATLCSSRSAVEEARINLDQDVQWLRLTRLAAAIALFEAAQRGLPRGLTLPEKDAPIVLTAIEARATHLLTGDLRHFESYFGSKMEGIMIMPAGAYLRLRAGGG